MENTAKFIFYMGRGLERIAINEESIFESCVVELCRISGNAGQ